MLSGARTVPVRSLFISAIAFSAGCRLGPSALPLNSELTSHTADIPLPTSLAFGPEQPALRSSPATG